MNRTTLTNILAALTFMIAPYATAAESESSVQLQPLVQVEESSEGSFFSPKSAAEIQELAVIDEDLEESLVWEKQGT